MQFTTDKQRRFFATGRALGFSSSDVRAAMVFRYGQTKDGKRHTPFTASVATGVPEARLQEVDHAVLNRIEQLHGAAAVHNHV